MKLMDLIGLYKSVMSKDICDYYINLYNENLDKSTRFNTTISNFDQLQLLKAGLDKPSYHFTAIVDKYAKSYFDNLKMTSYVPEKYGFEEVRIKHYTPDMGFKSHVDIMDHGSAKRFLVAILYLNDNDGDTIFDLLECANRPKTGDLLLFPPMWMFPHSTAKLSTDKYVMMTSLNYLHSTSTQI